MILTDEEIETVRNAALLSFRRHQSSVRGQQITQCDDPEYHLICAIESAVLEKLKAQKPFAFHHDEEGLSYSNHYTGTIPLYRHPLPPDDVVQKYEELLYAVHRKFPDETRHQTALRYIKTAESPSYTNASVKEG